MARVQRGCCGGGELTRPDRHDHARARGCASSAGKAAGNVVFRLCERRVEQLDGLRAAAAGALPSRSRCVEHASLPPKRWAGAGADPLSQGERRGRRGRRLCRRDRMQCQHVFAYRPQLIFQPLGRSCAPTPPRTRVKSGANTSFVLSCAQNRRAVPGGTIMCGARARARSGTRVAERGSVGR